MIASFDPSFQEPDSRAARRKVSGAGHLGSRPGAHQDPCTERHARQSRPGAAARPLARGCPGGFHAFNQLAHQLRRIPVHQVMDVGAVEPASTCRIDPYGRDPHPSLQRPTPEGDGLDIAIGNRPLPSLQYTPTDQQTGFRQRIAMVPTSQERHGQREGQGEQEKTGERKPDGGHAHVQWHLP